MDRIFEEDFDEFHLDIRYWTDRVLYHDAIRLSPWIVLDKTFHDINGSTVHH